LSVSFVTTALFFLYFSAFNIKNVLAAVKMTVQIGLSVNLTRC